MSGGVRVHGGTRFRADDTMRRGVRQARFQEVVNATSWSHVHVLKWWQGPLWCATEENVAVADGLWRGQTCRAGGQGSLVALRNFS